jgi:hypothetical protein
MILILEQPLVGLNHVSTECKSDALQDIQPLGEAIHVTPQDLPTLL